MGAVHFGGLRNSQRFIIFLDSILVPGLHQDKGGEEGRPQGKSGKVGRALKGCF